MRVRRIAILIDCGFFLKRLPKVVDSRFSKERSTWETQALQVNCGSVWHRGHISTAPKANYTLNSLLIAVVSHSF